MGPWRPMEAAGFYSIRDGCDTHWGFRQNMIPNEDLHMIPIILFTWNQIASEIWP